MKHCSQWGRQTWRLNTHLIRWSTIQLVINKAQECQTPNETLPLWEYSLQEILYTLSIKYNAAAQIGFAASGELESQASGWLLIFRQAAWPVCQGPCWKDTHLFVGGFSFPVSQSRLAASLSDPGGLNRTKAAASAALWKCLRLKHVIIVECWVLSNTSFPSDMICRFDDGQLRSIYSSTPSCDTHEKCSPWR